MLGMLGIIVKNNQIKNTTQILQVVKPGETYLVKFLNPPVFSRVCTSEEIQTWLLFDTQEDANAWVASSKQPPPEAQVPGKLPVDTPLTAKPNGSNNDLPDEETDDPEPEPEITPAAPVDTSRFERPDGWDTPTPEPEPDPGGSDVNPHEPEATEPSPDVPYKPRKHKPGKKS